MSDPCSEKCWTPVRCPVHKDLMAPRGRDAGVNFWHCCENYMRPDINPRHLWHEHDSTRWYTDPAGWEAHVEECEQCDD